MASSLTSVGFVWATLSILAGILCCTGFYLPFWIEGNLLGGTEAYFNSFRRCNYPRIGSLGRVEVVEECGRYAGFRDIPSPWWKATTVLVGIGSAISLFVAVTAIGACCLTYIVHAHVAKIAGGLQIFAAALILIGIVLYPIGWDNLEMRESCGNSSHIYQLGTCRLSWSLFLLPFAFCLLLLCFCLSFCQSRVRVGSLRI